MYTASTALLEALGEWGVSYIFANFGSDHPALIEAIAEAQAAGRPIPEVITCPNEMVALSCAHGYAQVTGRAQAVLVHVECGTQALDGAGWSPLAAQPLPADAVATIVDALARAHRPLVVTSYVGRNTAAVAELVRLSDRLGVGVLESVPCFANFPHSNQLYQGNHW